jgi:hypothetical protein
MPDSISLQVPQVTNSGQEAMGKAIAKVPREAVLSGCPPYSNAPKGLPGLTRAEASLLYASAANSAILLRYLND